MGSHNFILPNYIYKRSKEVVPVKYLNDFIRESFYSTAYFISFSLKKTVIRFYTRGVKRWSYSVFISF